MTASTITVGEALVKLLAAKGVDTVFGIPGVHTVELYRGLATSTIRHVTPRHELSAGFMADGYARVSGKAGVCLLITGPGLSNAISAMAQARADSIPMLIISGVNRASTLGHEEGHLHELPDQMGMMRTITLFSHHLQNGAQLSAVLDRAYAAMHGSRPGPVHIEIPIDVMAQEIQLDPIRPHFIERPQPSDNALESAKHLCQSAKQVVIIAGGGSTKAAVEIQQLAEHFDAPVVTTINARGTMSGHPLLVPASPSLASVRSLISSADLVIAVGTQLGPTDFDIYAEHAFKKPNKLLRIDIDPIQATRGVLADRTLIGDAAACVSSLVSLLGKSQATSDGADRASNTRQAAMAELSPKLQSDLAVLNVIKQAAPHCRLVGDSTQLVYAGNLYFDTNVANGWFNSSVGFGALGYGPPAAIGAYLADPTTPVICIVGDGGFQFCLAELGTAMDENAQVIFIVWNNHGYQEIEDYMVSNDIAPVGVTPSPPDFVKLANAYGMQADYVDDLNNLATVVSAALENSGPRLIEIRCAK